MKIIDFYDEIKKEIDKAGREMDLVIDMGIKKEQPVGDEIAKIREYIAGLNKALDIAMDQAFNDIKDGIN